jgi:hypothetical protein
MRPSFLYVLPQAWQLKHWQLSRVVLLVVMALVGCSGLLPDMSPAMAQGIGPNAGSLQQQMMMGPGLNRYGPPTSWFYGPIKREDVGLPAKGYDNPVQMQDGVLHGTILPKLPHTPASSGVTPVHSPAALLPADPVAKPTVPVNALPPLSQPLPLPQKAKPPAQ